MRVGLRVARAVRVVGVAFLTGLRLGLDRAGLLDFERFFTGD